ncbi:AAA family ATPase, partial [Collinsella aerofaciens]|uniref:AAA family ATPase n=1 Tax=Collinsella aerofaciens TaxID=74426 RepID=UPI001D02F150
MLDVNLSAIKQKLVDPSSKVELSDEAEALDTVKAAFGRIDKQIAANNELCDNISSARSDLSRRVWGLILHNLSSAQKAYSRSVGGCEKAISSIQAIIANKEDEKRKKQAEKAHLETTRTSITPTVDAINSLLERFGFTGFSLSEDKQSKGMYRIVRPDGADARRTLSEGEYNFISFLYFYHLVYGSLETEGIDTPRVVAIDDPISSLDSNVMFIITSLAKEIVKDCRDGKHGIKQVFILTHNVYFHKEVTFLGSRSKWP